MKKIIFMILFSTLTLMATPTDEAQAQDTTAWNIFKTGGPLMFPLVGCSCLVLGLIVYQFLELKANKFIPKNDVRILAQQLYARNPKAAYLYCLEHTSFLTKVLANGILRLNTAKNDCGQPAAENAIYDEIDNQETHINFWLNLISVIAAISPMIGLLGTVSGMIKAFQKIGMGGMGKPELLAGNIGEALITTATGLMVGIPAMLAFFIFRGKLDSLLAKSSQTISYLIDLYTGESYARTAYQESPEFKVYAATKSSHEIQEKAQ